MKLAKEHANKIINIENSPVVIIPSGEFLQGDMLILFNNSEEFKTIQSEIPNSYRSGYIPKCNFFEFPPHSIVNAVFVDADTIVFMRGMS